jgi:predicted Fe-Mo cluster-binding NifX family protein
MKKIALPVTEASHIDDHFGHCEFYNIYTIDENKSISGVETIASAQGCGCKSNIASVLAAKGVTTMLAGGIGAGAIHVLAAQGIEVVRGCSGKAEDVVKEYLAGQVSDSGSSCAQHDHHHAHGHDHGHQCGH